MVKTVLCFWICCFVNTLLYSQSIPANITFESGVETVIQSRMQYFGSLDEVRLNLNVEYDQYADWLPTDPISKLAIKPEGEDTIYFELFSVKYDTSKAIPWRLRNNAGPTWFQDALLMEVLYKGSIDLYQYVDPDGYGHLFVRKSQYQPFELIQNIYRDTVPDNEIATEIQSVIRYKNEDGRPRQVNYYLLQLFRMFEGCPEVQQQLLKTEYKVSDIQALLYQYDQCQHNTKVYYPRRKSMHRSWHAWTGVTMSEPATSKLLTRPDVINRGINYTAGFSAEWMTRSSYYGKALQVDLGVANFSTAFKGEFNGVTPVDSIVESHTAIILRGMFKFGGGAQRRNRFWMGVGPSFCFMPQRTITQHRLPGYFATTWVKDISVNQLNTEIGAGVALGWQKDKLGLQLRGDYTPGILNGQTFINTRDRPRKAAATLTVSYQIAGPVFW